MLNNYSTKLAGGKSLLYNKYLLYVSFAICLINLLIWMFSGEFIHVAVFLLVGFLTSYFSKNMIVILVMALVISNVFKSGSNIVLEGMITKGPDDTTNSSDPTSTSDKNKKTSTTTTSTIEGVDEKMNKEDSMEGVDMEETHEGIDDEQICKTDTDCKNGHRCNDSGVCAAVSA